MRALVFLLALCCGAALFVPGSGLAQTRPGVELAAACTGCHGTQGRSQGAIPSLAGMQPEAFTTRMQAFRQGEGTIMNRIAPAYDDADIDRLARYFAAQPAAMNSTDAESR